MSHTFNPKPPIPSEIENAAQSGELVVFVGAGISQLIGCPNWDKFAEEILKQLVPSGINYYELSQIQAIQDPKRKLSIAKIIAREKNINLHYKDIFNIELTENNVYTYLNKFNCTFVTTNYDKSLSPQSKNAEPEGKWRFYQKTDLVNERLDVNGNVIHLHGCIDDPKTMIITTRDYLDHYSESGVQEFLKYLFKRKTVLFLGYGLEEIEILEYILRRGGTTDEAQADTTRTKRFVLQGFFHAEMPLYEMLKSYYRFTFSVKLIGFPKDDQSYSQQVEILEEWAEKLIFKGMSLTDEASILEDEIDG
jgi:hypothetical protein